MDFISIPDVVVIIATSQKRTDWLIERSLISVYKQEGVNSESISVIIVDDNDLTDSNISVEFSQIKKKRLR